MSILAYSASSVNSTLDFDLQCCLSIEMRASLGQVQVWRRSPVNQP
jgi:hypothetical protein